MGNLFPGDFASEVLHLAVMLAATAISCSMWSPFLLTCWYIKIVLDEIVAEGKHVPFKCNVYIDVYIDLLGLMAKCDTSSIHCAKMKALHMHWAKTGR